MSVQQLDVGSLRGLLLQNFMEKHQIEREQVRMSKRLTEIETVTSVLIAQIAVHEQKEREAIAVAAKAEADKAAAAQQAEAQKKADEVMAAPSTGEKTVLKIVGDADKGP